MEQPVIKLLNKTQIKKATRYRISDKTIEELATRFYEMFLRANERCRKNHRKTIMERDI